MVRVIMGAKGSGKTKQLIEMINRAASNENGSVVCMEPSADMTYNISYNVRLVNASEYSVDSFECLRGFISGLYAGNYDITRVFIDGLYKITGEKDAAKAETFLDELSAFSEKHTVNFVVSLSEDPAAATEGMKKYL